MWRKISSFFARWGIGRANTEFDRQAFLECSGRFAMALEDVRRIEATLDTELPDFYQQFLLNYPDKLISIAKSGIGADGKAFCEGPADLELLNHADAIIALNERVPVGHWETEWSPEQFIIGENGCGDFFTIDLDDEYSSVFFFDHEASGFDEIAGSLEEFAGDLILKYTDIRKWAVHRSRQR